jgi:malate dehydrogenase
MLDAVLKDKHKVLPCCCYLEGEFGIKDLYVGVPAQLGQKGVEKIWEIKLTDTEAAALKKSAAAVQELVNILKL